MYMLYSNKPEKTITVRKARKVFENLNFTDEVKRHNDRWLYCSKRKPLIAVAKKIKEEWVEEAENDLVAIKSIRI